MEMRQLFTIAFDIRVSWLMAQVSPRLQSNIIYLYDYSMKTDFLPLSLCQGAWK